MAKRSIKTGRTGARRISEIDPKVLRELEAGRLETANLVECLAVDQFRLAKHVLPEIELGDLLPVLDEERRSLKKVTAVQVIGLFGRVIASQTEGHPSKRAAMTALLNHPSDLVRNWGAAVVGAARFSSLKARLTAIRPYAADSHFGVREIAWMVVRPAVSEDLTAALELLMDWSASPKDSIRRFASELTRPRGVWCKHLDELKANPALGLPLLEPLRSDSSKYVRDSVGNWLNDASKSDGAWVRKVCQRWQKESATPETEYIVKRALRSVMKSS